MIESASANQNTGFSIGYAASRILLNDGTGPAKEK